MSLVENIKNDMKKAMKARAELKLSVLRMLVTAIKNKQIELKVQEDLPDEQIVQVIKSEVKKRQDAISSYSEGGREDLANKEKEELEILNEYLPKQMSEEAVEKAVAEVVSSIGEVGEQDFGKVMGAVMAKLKGQADGGMVNQVVKRLLSK